MNISQIIKSYIIGDSIGLGLLNNDDNKIELKDNNLENIPKGMFSSMSSVMLAVIDSISEINKVNICDILNKMCTILIVGKYTNDGKVYKMDKETINILKHYSIKTNLNYKYREKDYLCYPISRILPIIIYNYYNTDTLDNIIEITSITTSSDIVLLGCYIYYKYVLNLLNGYNKFKALKIKIPSYFKIKDKIKYNNILKNNIYYKNIIFDDNIINVLSIVFYIILNSDNMLDVLNMCFNLRGNTNIYISLILPIATIIYGYDSIPNKLKNIKNKKEINKYIKAYEKVLFTK